VWKETQLVRKINIWFVRELGIPFILFLGVKLSLLCKRDSPYTPY
jgi:hypothetical protein